MCQTGTNQSQEQRLQWPTHMVSFSTIDLAHLKRQLAQHTVDSVVAVTEIIMNVSYLLFFYPSKIDFVLRGGDFECFSVFGKTHTRAPYIFLEDVQERYGDTTPLFKTWVPSF
mmetsp:Transcript_37612/g.56285  ORF Transcript_37612/g.56285 Transcript_37612/m.56285 type:complete len:113 (-) Transcript_37612:335-673(-)